MSDITPGQVWHAMVTMCRAEIAMTGHLSPETATYLLALIDEIADAIEMEEITDAEHAKGQSDE